jgi:hypothetical protein
VKPLRPEKSERNNKELKEEKHETVSWDYGDRGFNTSLGRMGAGCRQDHPEPELVLRGRPFPLFRGLG